MGTLEVYKICIVDLRKVCSFVHAHEEVPLYLRLSLNGMKTAVVSPAVERRLKLHC